MEQRGAARLPLHQEVPAGRARCETAECWVVEMWREGNVLQTTAEKQGRAVWVRSCNVI